MKSNSQLKKSITIDVSRSQLWSALTNPQILEETMFGCEVVTDWKPGGSMLFNGNWNGSDFVDKGKIISLENEVSFSYDYWSNFSGLPDVAENYSRINFEIEKKGDIAILHLTHQNFATEKMLLDSDKNWDYALESFKTKVEKIARKG